MPAKYFYRTEKSAWLFKIFDYFIDVATNKFSEKLKLTKDGKIDISSIFDINYKNGAK